MPMQVKVGSVFKDADPQVRVGSTWKNVEVGLVRVGGSWKEFYRRAHQVHIKAGTYQNLNILHYLTSAVPEDSIEVTIDRGAIIYSDDPTKPALDIPLHGHTNNKNIILNVKGEIYGAGGEGGKAGTAWGGSHYNVSDATDGLNGGPAIRSITSVEINIDDSTGKVMGGGGGGGGGASVTMGRLGGGQWRPAVANGGVGGHGYDRTHHGSGLNGGPSVDNTSRKGVHVRSGAGGKGGDAGSNGSNGGTARLVSGSPTGARRISNPGKAGRGGNAILIKGGKSAHLNEKGHSGSIRGGVGYF